MSIFTRISEEITGLKDGVNQLGKETDETKEKMSGMMDPLIRLRTEILALGSATGNTADQLRGLGIAGAKSSSTASTSGGMKTTSEMTAAELETLARALKPVLDKIDRRQL